MMIGLAEALLDTPGRLDAHQVAARFSENFNPDRGYGGTAKKILLAIREGMQWQHGVVSYTTPEGRNPMDAPDQIAWTSIPSTPPEGKKGTFAFILPPRKGEALKKILQTNQMQDLLATGKRTKGGRIVLRAKVDTEFLPPPNKTGFVEAWIRGTTHHDQQIVLTAHLQEEKWSANDDGSGCANILEMGRAYAKLIAEGKLPRPHRDIRFWWTDEIYSEYRYFSDHPDEAKKMLSNLHQDMVGANQAMGNRGSRACATGWRQTRPTPR